MKLKTIFFPAVFGVALGVASKAADVAAQGSLWGNIVWAFGLVTTGFLIWAVIGYFIASAVKELRLAIAANAAFFTGLLIAYYAYSYFVVKYLSIRVMAFWFAMLAAVVVATVLIHKFKGERRFKALSIAGVVGMAAVDILFIQGGFFFALVMELILLAAAVVIIVKNLQGVGKNG